MKVRATAITKSLVEDLDLSPEDLITYEARVSNPENQGNLDTADKLLKYLLDNAHNSPFDMVNLTVEVTTSKAIAIQILRHWSIKPQEFSQRYSQVTDIEPIEFRYKADKNRQSSDIVLGTLYQEEDGTITGVIGNHDGKLAIWIQNIALNLQKTIDLYKEGIELGVAKETARMILPMASSTTMYLNGSVRSWIYYLAQRTSKHAQKEHRLVALEIEKIFKQYFPNVAKALGI